MNFSREDWRWNRARLSDITFSVLQKGSNCRNDACILRVRMRVNHSLKIQFLFGFANQIKVHLKLNLRVPTSMCAASGRKPLSSMCSRRNCTVVAVPEESGTEAEAEVVGGAADAAVALPLALPAAEAGVVLLVVAVALGGYGCGCSLTRRSPPPPLSSTGRSAATAVRIPDRARASLRRSSASA